MKKAIILCLMVAVIFITCTGCKNQEKTLTICVDSFYVQEAKDLIDVWQHFNKDIKVDLVVIPQKAHEAEIKITEIRTAIMSGEGPDIFILTTDLQNTVDGPIPLFDNVEKTMQSEVFLPLDDYMAQAQYMHADAFNPIIFDSGKTDEGQLVLPISYGYTVGGYLKTDDTSPAELPYSWDELVNDKDYNPEKNYIPQFCANFIDVFGKYADYKSKVLLYTEAEILTRIQQAISMGTENYTMIDLKIGNWLGPMGYYYVNSKKKRGLCIQCDSFCGRWDYS